MGSQEGEILSGVSADVASVAIESALTIFDSLADATRRRVHSLVLYNSLVRGDYVPGVSDIDVLAVFHDPPPKEDEEAVRRCFTAAPGIPAQAEGEKAFIDLLAISVDEVPLLGTPAASRPSRWKMLSIYAFDFVAHSRILRGEDFRPRLVVRDPKSMVAERIEVMKERLAQPRRPGLEFMIALAAGECVRLAQIRFGEPTIDKRRVFPNFEKLVPEFEGKEFAKRLREEYLTGALAKKTPDEKAEYLRECESFIFRVLDLLSRSLASR